MTLVYVIVKNEAGISFFFNISKCKVMACYHGYLRATLRKTYELAQFTHL